MNGECIKNPPEGKKEILFHSLINNLQINFKKGHFMKMIKSNRGKMYVFEKCSKFCSACLDETTCTKCREGSNLMLNQCYPICDT